MLGHVPLIDHNPRRGEKIEFSPSEAARYKERSQAERTNWSSTPTAVNGGPKRFVPMKTTKKWPSLVNASITPDLAEGFARSSIIKLIQSAIGHQPTAEFLSDLFAFPVATNRIILQQTTNDLMLVFKLKGRPPEGKILSRAELSLMEYEFGVLRKIA